MERFFSVPMLRIGQFMPECLMNRKNERLRILLFSALQRICLRNWVPPVQLILYVLLLAFASCSFDFFSFLAAESNACKYVRNEAGFPRMDRK